MYVYTNHNPIPKTLATAVPMARPPTPHILCSSCYLCRPQEGLFGLREWIEEGYYPDGWVGPPDGLGLAPFKRRNNTPHQGGGGGGGSGGSGSKGGRPSSAPATAVSSAMPAAPLGGRERAHVRVRQLMYLLQGPKRPAQAM